MTVEKVPVNNEGTPKLSRADAIALRAEDRAALRAPTAELLRVRPHAAETRRAIAGFRARTALREVPLIGPALGAVNRALRGGKG